MQRHGASRSTIAGRGNMIRKMRTILALPIGLAGLLFWATALSAYLGFSRGNDDTITILFVMGFIAFWLSRAIYPDVDEETEQSSSSDGISDETNWQDVSKQADDAVRAEVASTAPAPAYDGLLDIINARHNLRRQSSTAPPSVPQIPPGREFKPHKSKDRIDEGRDLLSTARSLGPGDKSAGATARAMLKLAKKLAATGRTMARNLDRRADRGEHISADAWAEADLFSDLAFDLKFETARLRDRDEIVDW